MMTYTEPIIDVVSFDPDKASRDTIETHLSIRHRDLLRSLSTSAYATRYLRTLIKQAHPEVVRCGNCTERHKRSDHQSRYGAVSSATGPCTISTCDCLGFWTRETTGENV